MLQRIQTVYLLTIVLLSSIVLFSPLALLYNATDALMYSINYKGIFLIESTGNVWINSVWGLTAISSLIPLVSLVTIFLYKNRILQLRLSFFNTVMMAGYYVLLFIYVLTASKSLNAEWSIELLNAFPMVCIVINILAIRAIGKDEALVKSLNRLR